MKTRFRLSSPASPAAVLESISASHLEPLRVWKNAHRDAFFHQSTITPAQQEDWYRLYLGRPDDHLFVIRAGAELIGSIGCRRETDGTDIYNLMRGCPGGPADAMRCAVRILCSFAGVCYGFPVHGRVGAANFTAARWQRSCGALISGRGEFRGAPCYFMEYPAGSAVPLSVEVLPDGDCA